MIDEPLDTAPFVSICMVTFGAREWVERALDAVVTNTPTGRYELVVVDNASDDGTGEFVRAYASRTDVPMRVELSADNLGFAAGHDLAANLARGDVLCLLNSDALVPPGWFDALLAPLVTDPTIAATLPLFVGLDGRLQEAGANVEPDGRVEAFGIRADPDDVEWSWPRRVTYGSAACWMVRTAVFRALGGLDAGYGLGYYEDADFAFELTRRRLHIDLVPDVRVVHAQGASSPSSAVAVERRDANQARLVARQRALLEHRWHTLDLPNEPHRYYAARDVDVAYRVLLVLDDLPKGGLPDWETPDSRLTVALPAARLERDTAAVRQLRARGVEVIGDAEQALADRLFLLDEVIAPTAWLDDQTARLDECQPQAHRVRLEPAHTGERVL
ncbi:MAG TPA: glycosyltransferase [Acidimicrobiia bacterium]|jgi:GT2 family glycosyltransferase